MSGAGQELPKAPTARDPAGRRQLDDARVELSSQQQQQQQQQAERLMLARNAESLYWIGRYVERAEDTARILDVTVHQLLEDATVDPTAPAPCSACWASSRRTTAARRGR